MADKPNGRAMTVTLCSVLAALMLLLGVLNGIPWASKDEMDALRADIHRELSEIKADVREIRNAIRSGR